MKNCIAVQAKDGQIYFMLPNPFFFPELKMQNNLKNLLEIKQNNGRKYPE